MAVEDDEAGAQPGDAEYHPVEYFVWAVLAQVVHSAADEVSLVRVSIPAQEGSDTDHGSHTPDHDDHHLHP